jgi:transcriptional regulator with XRE-family HTH domain
MSELKTIRENKNLTQEELAKLSGLSVRTIQRIEAGIKPKGYTLKTLARTLDISELELLEPRSEPDIFPEFVVENKIEEKVPIINYSLIKMINLSSIPVCWFPVLNFLPPLIMMFLTKENSKITKQIISLQIFFAIICPVIFMMVIFLKLGKTSVLMTIIALTLANICIILINTFEIDRRKRLYYKLNFSLI